MKVEVLSGFNKYLENTLESYPYNAFPSQFFIPCFYLSRPFNCGQGNSCA